MWKVQPRHVTEAYQLLNKSIIRVEQPDVYLDEEEENVDDEEATEPTEPSAEVQDQGLWLLQILCYIVINLKLRMTQLGYKLFCALIKLSQNLLLGARCCE